MGTLVRSLISAVQCELWGKLLLSGAARDISDLSVAQERLRRSEETFRKIFNASLDAMTIIDAEPPVLYRCESGISACHRLQPRGNHRQEPATISKQWVESQSAGRIQRLLIENGEVRNIRPKDAARTEALLLASPRESSPKSAESSVVWA